MPRARAPLGTSSGAWISTRASAGTRGPGPLEARCAPLVRLLLLSDPDCWCSGTRKHLGQLPGLCSAHGGAAGHEQWGFFFFGWCSFAPSASQSPQKISDFSNTEFLSYGDVGYRGTYSKVSLTDFYFRIAFDFVENGERATFIPSIGVLLGRIRDVWKLR